MNSNNAGGVLSVIRTAPLTPEEPVTHFVRRPSSLRSPPITLEACFPESAALFAHLRTATPACRVALCYKYSLLYTYCTSTATVRTRLLKVAVLAY